MTSGQIELLYICKKHIENKEFTEVNSISDSMLDGDKKLTCMLCGKEATFYLCKDHADEIIG